MTPVCEIHLQYMMWEKLGWEAWGGRETFFTFQRKRTFNKKNILWTSHKNVIFSGKQWSTFNRGGGGAEASQSRLDPRNLVPFVAGRAVFTFYAFWCYHPACTQFCFARVGKAVPKGIKSVQPTQLFSNLYWEKFQPVFKTIKLYKYQKLCSGLCRTVAGSKANSGLFWKHRHTKTQLFELNSFLNNVCILLAVRTVAGIL